MGKIEVELKNVEAGLKLFEAYLKKNSGDAEVYQQIAKIKSLQGDARSAIENYDKAIELDPTKVDYWLKGNGKN